MTDPAVYNLATLTLENFDPPWLWLTVIVVSIGVLVGTYRGIQRRSGRNLAWALFALRVLGVAALLVALVKPAWKARIEKEDKPNLVVIVDNSQSMSLPLVSGADADAESISRYEAARRWIGGSDVANVLDGQFELQLLNIAGGQIDGDLPREPDAEQTDLLRAIRSAEGRLRGRHGNSVVLISDGRDTTGRGDYLTMQESPLHAFTIGFPHRRSGGDAVDLAVVSAQAPRRVLVHNDVPVKVLISKDGGEAVQIPLQIERSGRTLASQHVSLAEGPGQEIVTLTFKPQQAGDFVMTARLGAAPGELTAANNSYMFPLKVDEKPIRVFYAEGFLRSEYTYLRDRLADDPDVDLITFVRSANPDQASVAGVLMSGDVLSDERLEQLDVVLLGDFEASMLDERAYEVLRNWVEAGGGLMVLGGYRNLGAAGLINTSLAEAVPVELGVGVEQIEEPFAFTLTDQGKRHPALFITGDIQQDAAQWRKLPKLRGIAAVGAARPGATVLARHPRSGADGQGLPVLVTQRFGKGNVMLITADTTWRWSRIARLSGRPDTLYIRFWSQMIRHLAGRDVKDLGPALIVATDKPAYERGKRVSITIRRNPAVAVPGQSDQNATLAVAVAGPGGRTSSLPVTPGTADPDESTASYFPDRGGRFEITTRLVAPGDAGPQEVANQITEFLVYGASLELDDPATNPLLMRRIATVTGGTYADIDDDEALATLIGSLPAEPRVRFETKTRRAWHSPTLFVFFIIVITAEWILRRRNRMV